jgi:uncharacterized membrane protein
MNGKFLLTTFLTGALLVSLATATHAQNNSTESKKYKGVITEVKVQGHNEFGENYQELETRLNSGNKVNVINNPQNSGRTITYKVGDKVVVQEFPSPDSSEKMFVITDFQRTGYIQFLFFVFVVLAVLIGRKHGLYSIIGMMFSFFVIFNVILPQIIKGSNPVLVTILASMFIVPVNFYLSHGFNKKTHIAILSTMIALMITAILTSISVYYAKLTGYSSEEAMFLQIANQSINMKGILLAGIIIGFLGVLDDVTVSQSSIVSQLRKSKRNYEAGELYNDAMNVGRDHITSMINTLVLVYAGASMPLLLLFINNPQPVMDVINLEIIADEVIRTLVGSIGLILAVPLSTFIASNFSDE